MLCGGKGPRGRFPSRAPCGDGMYIDQVETKQAENESYDADKYGERWSGLGHGFGWILPAAPLTKKRDSAHHDVAFNRKGREPQEAKDRHFKDLQPAYIGYGIFPLG